MRIGYIRVSSTGQHTERQEDSMKELKVERVFIEKASGKNRKDRPQLKALMNFVQDGDIVVVHELSRLGRSVVDLYDIAKELKDKGVGLESLKENIDLSCATGNLTFGILAVMAQFERELVHERQAEGIAAAKARGRNMGMQRRYGTDKKLAESIFARYRIKEISSAEACAILKMPKGTFYYQYKVWRKAQGDEEAPGESEQA